MALPEGDAATSSLPGADEEDAKALLLAMEKYHPIVRRASFFSFAHLAFAHAERRRPRPSSAAKPGALRWRGAARGGAGRTRELWRGVRVHV